MRKLFKERKLFKGGNYMRKYGNHNFGQYVDEQVAHEFEILNETQDSDVEVVLDIQMVCLKLFSNFGFQ